MRIVRAYRWLMYGPLSVHDYYGSYGYTLEARDLSGQIRAQYVDETYRGFSMSEADGGWSKDYPIRDMNFIRMGK
jgi:hypothetical protein